MDARLLAQPQSVDPSAGEESPDAGDRDPTTGPLSRTFLSGTLLTAAGRYGNYLVQLVTTAVLARLLAPDAFGIIAMVTVYTGFATILADSGINAAVIQRRSFNHRELSTTFWFSASIGSALVLLTLMVAPVVESV